ALVVAADARRVEPESELEPLLGDGALAVAVGRDAVVAELVATASVSEEFTYVFRTDEQRYLQVAEPRFGATYGYARDMGEATAPPSPARRPGLPPARARTRPAGPPGAPPAANAARRAGCEPGQLEASPLSEVGVLATAEPLVLLARSLETVKPGDFLVAGAY